MKIIPGKVRPLSRRLAEAHPQVSIIARTGSEMTGAVYVRHLTVDT
ncbi:hypothetical protein [Mycolicibacterium fortuitum]|nr:hypothetical protein [Mycolicibacterium fortuitum]